MPKRIRRSSFAFSEFLNIGLKFVLLFQPEFLLLHREIIKNNDLVAFYIDDILAAFKTYKE